MTDPPFEHARPSLRLDEPELPVADADESEVTSAEATVALSDVESELERRPLRSVTEEIFGESDSDEEVLIKMEASPVARRSAFRHAAHHLVVPARPCSIIDCRRLWNASCCEILRCT